MRRIIVAVLARALVLIAAALVMVSVLARVTAPFQPAAAQALEPGRQQADAEAAKAEGETAKPDAETAKAEGVPLTDVVMYTAGVGYFEHRAKLAGNGTLELRVEREEISDLLKSLIVQDFGDGKIHMVTYESHAPAERALESFALDLAGNPSLADLLRQARGEAVTVNAPNATTGTIVSVEEQKRPVGSDDEQLMTVHVLNLLVKKTVKPIALNLVQGIEFEDPKLNADFQAALQVLARSHNSDQKTLQLEFTGDKQRAVRVGYVRPTPVWKMTYRLALGDEQQHVLQGWAIVENTTQADWKDVSLTLVSGQPITFSMPLYVPLFVDRPTVKLDLYESLAPQKYAQDLSDQAADRAKAPAAQTLEAETAGRKRAGLRRNALQFGGAAQPQRMTQDAGEEFNLRQGVQAVAEASELGELFQYEVKSPVTLSGQQSALLPVLNAKVEGEQFSIYDQSVLEKHPLYGLRLTNTSDLYLMEGPITVFDDGRYAGDAIVDGIAPGSQRLISYGIDLEVEVAPETDAHNRSLRQVRIVNGTLHARYQQLQEKIYQVKNSSDQEKRVLIVVAKQANWKLVSPEAADSTRDAYRFLVTPAAQETVELHVELERTISEQVALTNLNHDALVYYVSSDSISDQAQRALSEVAERKQEIQRLQDELERVKGELNDISTQQQRIRQNMQQLSRETDLYARYVTKLGRQEDAVEELQSELDSLQQQLSAQRSDLNAYLNDLTIE